MILAMLVNPAARNGAQAHAARKAADRLRQHGHTVAVISGGSTAESSRLASAAIREGIDGLVVVGGDGTINLAVQHLAGTGIPLGVVPAGTGNDFAGALGLPVLDPETAADVIDAGQLRTLDLGRVIRDDHSSQYFATVVASGFDSYVNDRANRMRWPRGEARYNLAILIEFVLLRSTPYTVEVDGQRVDGPFVMATVGNTTSYGGGIPICPDADPSDGLLDVTVIRPAGRLRLLRLMSAVFKGAHVGHAQVETFRGRSIRLDAAGITAYADGDPMGELPLTVELVSRTLRVFAPEP